MNECFSCGVTVDDLPWENSGWSREEFADSYFVSTEDGHRVCMGCIVAPIDWRV